MKSCLCAFLTALAAACLLAGADTAELKQAEMKWVEAVKQNDLSALDKLLGEKLVYTHSTGLVETKAQYLAKLKSGEQKYAGIDHSDMSLATYGDTGVIAAQVRMTGSTKGVPFDNKLRVLHVWVKAAGGWQLVAHQTTRLP